MKKILYAVAAILLVCLGLGYEVSRLEQPAVKAKKQSLIIYNWGDYLDPALIKKFEHQTGYHIIYETFDSNEAMYTKIKQGGTAYDIAVPSEYMVTKMEKAHLLDKIDPNKLSNFKYLGNSFIHQSFDKKNEFSIPYFWGTLGIIYNDKFVRPGSITKWDDLWSKKYRNNILLVDSARDIMGFALVSLGYSMNTTNLLKLRLALTKLNGLGSNVKAVIADEMKMYMVQNEAAIGVSWSGEAADMMANNSHLHYVVPKEGSNLWFDNFVIPRTAKNKKAAYAFINFMLDPKNAAQNAEYVGYATPNEAAMKLLPKSIKNDKQFYPDPSTLKNLQVYRDLGPKVTQAYNDLFLEFKMYGR
ncbi:ABC transporter substrate-binding protein [Lactobacillus gigeriorum]|uniref:Spermidine putrescine ABC superfamily ATP binding cassette transporter, binding protein n=1 Tax=Lactobacillus gigeriorum DSM 23908 = CRBIP 24.85 TaxID=1423751 RepID=I7J331_9LACO|nr:ABC transporter substrate-binding protein [Lactobacillus gigeriorum]KRN14811.1 spermidine putrescine ABC superfamily ATP binding cassette transporter, binding protein [Lactobacillus gigeriorum DSM 23908 = CRBIP 24.85]CCI87277.1 Spermidine/putrescine ABC superfamily ATP binding cassette transporter, binding protein [Lactobacillus gigeriorum DSM 23908 = CRBIP 24.85]